MTAYIKKVYGVLLAGNTSLECKEYGFIGCSKREVEEYARQFAVKLGILHNGEPYVIVENGWTESLKKGFTTILQDHTCMEDILNFTPEEVEFGDGFVVVPEKTRDISGVHIYLRQVQSLRKMMHRTILHLMKLGGLL